MAILGPHTLKIIPTPLNNLTPLLYGSYFPGNNYVLYSSNKLLEVLLEYYRVKVLNVNAVLLCYIITLLQQVQTCYFSDALLM